MRYVRPSIIRRETIVGLAAAGQSDLPPKDAVPSDFDKKDNIVPVEWSEPLAVRYEAPAIARRDPIAGLAGTAPSDLNPRPDLDSDVAKKHNVVPVRW